MFECFKHKKVDEVKTVITKPNSEIPDIKEDYLSSYRHICGDPEINEILIVVGHTKKSWGAATYKKEREYEFNKNLALMIKTQIHGMDSNKKVDIQFRDVGGLKGAFSRGAKMQPDLTLELHFNSFSKPAYGCETLVLKDDEDSAEVGHALSCFIADQFDFKKRNYYKHPTFGRLVGVKPVGYKKKSKWSWPKRERGTYNLEIARDYTPAPFRLLIEPTFLNFKTVESEKIVEDRGAKLAIHIAEFMVSL